ncbi:MAG: hypothetical protein IAF02_16515 [Anaerolineae bacterium]|nr:hypothetical protein [Anaerolineae bacterium]
MAELKENYIAQILRDLQPGGKPKILSGGLRLRQYDLHGMSELVVWREEGVEPSGKELEVIEDSLRFLYAPDFLIRTNEFERSGASFAYRFFWPQKKGRMQVLTVQMKMALGV